MITPGWKANFRTRSHFLFTARNTAITSPGKSIPSGPFASVPMPTSAYNAKYHREWIRKPR